MGSVAARDRTGRTGDVPVREHEDGPGAHTVVERSSPSPPLLTWIGATATATDRRQLHRLDVGVVP